DSSAPSTDVGNPSRRSWMSDRTVVASMRAAVTPPARSSIEGVTLPWLTSDGVTFFGLPFSRRASDSSSVQSPSGVSYIGTAFSSMPSGSILDDVLRPTSMSNATISEVQARSYLAPRPPRGPVESHAPNTSAAGAWWSSAVALRGVASVTARPTGPNRKSTSPWGSAATSVDGGCDWSCRVGGGCLLGCEGEFVLDGGELAEAALASAAVVGVLDPADDLVAELGSGPPDSPAVQHV